MAKGKQKRPARKSTCSVPKERLQAQNPAPPDGATEIPHPFDTAPAEIPSLPGDRSPTLQPEGVRPSNRRRKKKKGAQQDHQAAAKLDQPPDSPTDSVDPATEQDDANATSSKTPGDGPGSPKREVIDLTIKEESRSGTPMPPPQTPESNEDPTGLKAGWVRFPVVLILNAL